MQSLFKLGIFLFLCLFAFETSFAYSSPFGFQHSKKIQQQVQNATNSTGPCPDYTTKEECRNVTGCCWQNYEFYGFAGNQCVNVTLGGSTIKLLLGLPISTRDSEVCTLLQKKCSQIDTTNFCPIMNELSRASVEHEFKVNECQCFGDLIRPLLLLISLVIGLASIF